MRYYCTLLSVPDIYKAQSSYEKIFGLEVSQDYDKNIPFSCGVALQQDFDWSVGQIHKKPNNVELAFEGHDFEGFLQKLNDNPTIELLGRAVEHDWGQRIIRFHDLDGHLIEVGKEMKIVMERFTSDGMTLEKVSKKNGCFC